jgi:hypothetical protein
MGSPSTSAQARLPVAEIAALWLAVAILVALINWAQLDQSFGSPDNLMRLVEVRGLLDGAPWFDPHELRLAPPEGYDTHWSRLIDAGITGLIVLFRHLASPDLAERLARCIWPLLLSGPAVAATVAAAVRLGGAAAGRATLVSALLILVAAPGQFRPGEIDHHNAQIMLSLVVMACTLWGQRPLLAAAAGVAGGVLLGVGLEATHVLLCAAVTFAVLAAYDPTWSRQARAFALALGTATPAIYLLVTPSALRFAPQCDALAVNSTAAVVVAAAGVAVIATFGEGWTRTTRLVALALGGALALATFAVIEPRCLRGPFGLVDRSIVHLWLDNVSELQGLASLFRATGLQALVHIGFPIVAALSAVAVTRAGLRTPLAWALIAALAVAAVIGAGQIRMMVYVIWLGLPFVGVAADRLAERTSRPLLARVGAAAFASPPVISLMILSAVSAVAGTDKPEHVAQWAVDASACFRPDLYRAIAQLPPGLVMAPLEVGPSVLAHTGHSVVAAPYHRADRAIRFNEEVMNGTSAAARPRLLERGVDYVITCAEFPTYANPDSFFNALLADNAGAWLEPVAMPEGNILKVWRVVPGR